MDSVNFFYPENLSAFFGVLVTFFVVLYGAFKAVKFLAR